MTGEGTLWVIGEIAIGFAGFTGVVAVFGKQSWGALNRYRFTALWATSLSTMLFALFPFLLFHSDLSASAVWRYSSIALAILLVTVNCIELPRAWKLGPILPVADKVVLSGLTLILLAAIGRLCWNAMSSNPSFAPYLAALMYLLLVATTMFVRLLSSHVSGSIEDLPAQKGR